MFLRNVLNAAVVACVLCFVPASFSQDTADSSVIQTDALIIVKVKDSNEYLAYSKSVGKWSKFAFPEGVEARPVFGKGVCAFYVEGEKIEQIVAVDLEGNWCPMKLTVPQSKCVPFMSDKVAGFIVNGMVYAFSGELGKWDTVEATVIPQLSTDSALIVTSDLVAAFSAATAKWAVAKTTR